MSLTLCDAGPLIALSKLNHLDLLADLYGVVQVPRVVYDEVVPQALARGATDALTMHLFWRQHAWPLVEVPSALLIAYTPPVVLHPGEIHLLALAQTLDDPLVLLDDEVARNEARRLHLRVRGTSGVLVQAYRQQLLTLAQAEFLIREIAARPDIWIAAQLCEQVLSGLKQAP